MVHWAFMLFTVLVLMMLLVIGGLDGVSGVPLAIGAAMLVLILLALRRRGRHEPG